MLTVIIGESKDTAFVREGGEDVNGGVCLVSGSFGMLIGCEWNKEPRFILLRVVCL